MNVVRRHDMDHGMTPPPPMDHSNDTMGGNMHMDNMNDTHMTMSHMTFYWGKNGEILFSGWPGMHGEMYALALILVFILSFLVEWLSHSSLMMRPGGKNVAAGIFQTIVHAIRVGLAYLVMLALMSFNGGVFVVAVLGHTIGFFIFGSRAFKKKEELPYEANVTSALKSSLPC